MTYCVAVRLEAGMIFASDTRTNAGMDQMATFGKMRVYEKPGERVAVTLSSGNLAMTQGAINLLERAAATGEEGAEHPRLFHVYPEGNFIEATDETPYFQLGESKYGKPILDRVVTPAIAQKEAAKCVLVSFDSTMD